MPGNLTREYFDDLLTSPGSSGQRRLDQAHGVSVAGHDGLHAQTIAPKGGTSREGVTRSAEGHLGSLCRQFQRRLPLRAVSLNLGTGPSWKRLETPEPEQQGLQGAARSAKCALGAMSQRIQESCQSGTKWLMGTRVKVRRKREAQKDRGSPPPSLNQKNTRLCRANRDARIGGNPRLSGQMGSHGHRRQRLRREAALRSPCSSTEPLCSPSESDSDLEPVGAGIQHLQKLSQKLDKAIKAEESGDMTVSLICE